MHLGKTECRVPSLGRVLDLTSDIAPRIRIESGAYLLYSLKKEFQIWCMNASWDGRESHTILGSL